MCSSADTSMLLTGSILLLTAAFFWAGFKAPKHPLQYQSQAGFVVTLGLAGFTGYFAWRESRTVAELAEFIDPVPEITDVSYVPTSGEVASLSQALASAPSSDRLGATVEGRDQASEGAAKQYTDYWLLKTSLPPDSVLAFYRRSAPVRGWHVDRDTPPWLFLSRESLRMVLFVSDESPRPGSRVLYSLSPVGP